MSPNRLSKSQLKVLEESLQVWMNPQEMLDIVGDQNADMGSKNFFNQGGLAFLRDAVIAGNFAKDQMGSKVRLVGDIWPDFEVEIDGGILSFEAIEADDPARRRGDEYRTKIAEIENDPDLGVVEYVNRASSWLKFACAKKVAKKYGGRSHLVIMLNLMQYDWHQKEIEYTFPAATIQARDHFQSVWVLWKNKSYKIWDSKTP